MTDPGRPGPRKRPTAYYVSKSDLVTDALRELITGLKIAPGTPLRQRELAEQFDVSYTPVREALRRLESEGLVVRNVHRGATVSRAEPDELAENYQILAVLEGLAGRFATVKLTDEDLIEIEARHQEIAACADDDERFGELNRRFHFRIYECARSPILLALMRLLWRAFPAGPASGRPRAESVLQHASLVEALKLKDEQQVAEIISEHVLGSIKYLASRADQ